MIKLISKQLFMDLGVFVLSFIKPTDRFSPYFQILSIYLMISFKLNVIFLTHFSNRICLHFQK